MVHDIDFILYINPFCRLFYTKIYSHISYNTSYTKSFVWTFSGCLTTYSTRCSRTLQSQFSRMWKENCFFGATEIVFQCAQLGRAMCLFSQFFSEYSRKDAIPKKLSGDYCYGRFGGIRDFVVVIKMLTVCWSLRCKHQDSCLEEVWLY